jgi:hypothetical protein
MKEDGRQGPNSGENQTADMRQGARSPPGEEIEDKIRTALPIAYQCTGIWDARLSVHYVLNYSSSYISRSASTCTWQTHHSIQFTERFVMTTGLLRGDCRTAMFCAYVASLDTYLWP